MIVIIDLVMHHFYILVAAYIECTMNIKANTLSCMYIQHLIDTYHEKHFKFVNQIIRQHILSYNNNNEDCTIKI